MSGLLTTHLAAICGVPSSHVSSARRLGMLDREIFERFKTRPRHMAHAMIGARDRVVRVEILEVHSPFGIPANGFWKRVWFARVLVEGESEPRDIAVDRITPE